jgi:solute:Na+ symporter, SSS family
MTPVLAAIIAFMAVQFGIGVWVSRRIRTEDDYLVAGRTLGYPLAIFSLFATWFGAETVVGAAGTSFSEGVSLSSAEPFGYGLCLVIMGLVFATSLWRRQLTTLADLFRQRYSDRVEQVAAIILIPTSVLWAAAQVRAFGHVLSDASTLETEAAIAVAAGVTIAYTAFGGLLVDAITDLIQGALLTLGLVIILIVTIVNLGGLHGATEAVLASDRISLTTMSGTLLETLEAWAIPILGSVVATEVVGRVIATRTPTVARRSSIAAGAIYIAVGLIPVFVGVTAWVFVPDVADPEQVMPAVARLILPSLAYAIFAGGLLCAILSTVDSTLLVASGLLSHNLVIPLLPTVTERTRVRLARGGVVGFGILAYLLARQADSVYGLIEQSSALGSSGVLVTVTFGLFTPWGGPKTALATLCVGVTVYMVGGVLGITAPFLTSLSAALVTYVGGAIIGRGRHRTADATAGLVDSIRTRHIPQ